MKEFKPLKYKWTKCHNKLITKKLVQENYTHYFLYKGLVGLKALQSEVISSKELKAIITALQKKCGRQFKIWIYCYPNVSLTSKSVSVRMGKGMGSLDSNWFFVIKKNTVFLEFSSKSLEFLLTGVKSCKNKIKIKSQIIQKITKWDDLYR